MSAFGGKADVNQGVVKCPLIAKSGPKRPQPEPAQQLVKETAFALPPVIILNRLSGHAASRSPGLGPSLAFPVSPAGDGRSSDPADTDVSRMSLPAAMALI